MRLYANEKEALTLIEALNEYISQGLDKCGRAQELLLRIQNCLDLQGYERKSSDSD